MVERNNTPDGNCTGGNPTCGNVVITAQFCKIKVEDRVEEE